MCFHLNAHPPASQSQPGSTPYDLKKYGNNETTLSNHTLNIISIKFVFLLHIVSHLLGVMMFRHLVEETSEIAVISADTVTCPIITKNEHPKGANGHRSSMYINPVGKTKEKQ